MTAETPSIHTLQATARWTAAVRAGERERPDRLIDDPWAADLAGPEGMAWLAGRPEGSVLPIVIRTRYFDDWLRTVAIEGPMRQVVLLGAGLDTRAWRLPWPAGVVVYELDRAEVLEAKARILAGAGAGAEPACDRRPVAADLASDWGAALRDAGFDPTVPAAWLVEGVLFYLPEGVIRRVLEIVSSLAASGSRLGFDIVNPPSWSRPTRRHGSTCRQPPGRHGSGRWTTRVRCSRTSAGRRRSCSRANRGEPWTLDPARAAGVDAGAAPQLVRDRRAAIGPVAGAAAGAGRRRPLVARFACAARPRCGDGADLRQTSEEMPWPRPRRSRDSARRRSPSSPTSPRTTTAPGSRRARPSTSGC